MSDPSCDDVYNWFSSSIRMIGRHLLPPTHPYDVLVPELFGHEYRLYRHSAGLVVVQLCRATGVVEEFEAVRDDHHAKVQVMSWILEYWHSITARENEHEVIVEAFDPPLIESAIEYVRFWDDVTRAHHSGTTD